MPFEIMKPKELLITRLQEHIVPFNGGAQFSLLEVASPLHAQGRSGLPKYRPLLG
jgi:hypothetical protein